MEVKEKEINELVLASELSTAVVSKELIESPAFSTKYTCLVNMITQLQDIKKAVDGELAKIVKDNYFETGDSSIVTEGYRYTYVPANTKQTVDSKKLKSEDPELYKKYVKITNVSESFRVTPIKKKEDPELIVVESASE